MMNGYGTGSGSGSVVMLVVSVALIGLVAFALVRLVGGGHDEPDTGGDAYNERTSREILDRRLAAGEIDADMHRAVVDRLAHGPEAR
jgi:uncharacterized membrane protein